MAQGANAQVGALEQGRRTRCRGSKHHRQGLPVSGALRWWPQRRQRRARQQKCEGSGFAVASPGDRLVTENGLAWCMGTFALPKETPRPPTLVRRRQSVGAAGGAGLLSCVGWRIGREWR